MARVIDFYFDEAFARERDELIGQAKQIISRSPQQCKQAGSALDSQFTEALARERLRAKGQEHHLRANGQATPPPASSRSKRGEPAPSQPPPPWPSPESIDNVRVYRLRLAVEDLVARSRPGDALRFLGPGLPRQQRETNAYRALIITLPLLDPDADTYLAEFTELSRGPWAGTSDSSSTALGRLSLMQSWAHEGLALLKEAVTILAPPKPQGANVVVLAGAHVATLMPGDPSTPPDLRATFERFYEVLDATTIPYGDGGRRINGVAHAIALSQITDALHHALAGEWLKLRTAHGQSIQGPPPGLSFVESDSPDGPWTPVPTEKITSTAVPIGLGGADATLIAALDSAMLVTGFPAGRWNAMQAQRPGGPHQRWHSGEVISAEALASLESVTKLLRLSGSATGAGRTAPPKEPNEAPPKQPEPEIIHGEDFTWVVWYGTHYEFSKGGQSESVRALWREWERSGKRPGCGLSEKTIGEKIGSANENFRLALVFRDHPAWDTMIQSPHKGVFALAAPESREKHTS